jgi:hypothetical protein
MAFVVARLNSALDAALSGVTHAQLHTGAPGAAGTSNVAAGVARCALTGIGSSSGGADSATGTWTIPGAGGPFTHFGLWTDVSAGTFVGDGTLDPDETFAGAGTLGFTLSATAT